MNGLRINCDSLDFPGPIERAVLPLFSKYWLVCTQAGPFSIADKPNFEELEEEPLCSWGNIADDKGVCLGFADALVSRLGNLQGMDVLPTSAMLSVPAEMSASDVGSRLGVRFVVHGAIRESKGQWRLSLQMFDTHLHGGDSRGNATWT